MHQSPPLAQLRETIISVFPEFARSRFALLNEGWDSTGVEVDGAWIFKFPRHPEAIGRLRKEHRTLGFIRPRIDMPVPDMSLIEAPTLFSRHRKLPGNFLQPQDHEPLTGQQRDAIAEQMALLYAQLHAIPLAEARAIGLAPIDPWKAPADILAETRPRLPERLLPHLERTVAAYAALPPDDQVFGYFDGHGWNMAFDHPTGVLNGVYDFADSGLGDRHQDLSYSNWISPDLTERIIARYERLTGLQIDRERVGLYSGTLRFIEYADTPPDDPELPNRLESINIWFPPQFG